MAWRLFFFLVLAVTSALTADDRPNILFLFSDDQRPDTLSCLGSQVQTPHLDQLARRGVLFRNAHAPNPLCVTSRAEILTGCTGFTNGVLIENRLNDTLPLWPAVLQTAGYETLYVGKWHTSGRPQQRGYVRSHGLFGSGGGRFWKDHTDFKGTPVTGYRGWIFQTDERQLFPEHGVGLTADISKRFADAAIDLIKQPREKPFFIHVNFTAPHDPLILPPGYAEKYPPAEIKLPKNFAARHPFDHGNFEGRDEKMLPWPRTPQAVRGNLAMYYRVINHLDDQIGRIIKALSATGQLRNTIVIFSSDHGLAVGSHGLMGKQNMYEHTVRVPMIVAGPGIQQGTQSRAFVYLRDLFPTTCDLAGIDVPDHLESISFAPLLKGNQMESRKRVFCYFRDSQRMIRDKEWKLIHYPQIDRYQLFRVADDPDELRDLADDPQFADVRRRMTNQLVDWRKKMNDPISP